MGVERSGALVIRGHQKFRGFVQASFELGRDDPLAPDMRSSCVGFLARVNIEQGGGVTGLDNFAGKDCIGEARATAVSLNVLGNTGCVVEDGVTTRAVERLRDAMHLS